MTGDQILLLIILSLTVIMFLWGRLRHDLVAVCCLLACVLVGIVPSDHAFQGFGHPAVITVACILILSSGLQSTGGVDWLSRKFLPAEGGWTYSMLSLIGLGAFLSSFMNNVGAMALLMPVAVQMAKRLEVPAGQVLMPLAFGTILGGMTTLIGTPPNLIVSGFRKDVGEASFSMFDFTPVGLAVAVCGIAVLIVVSRWLVPIRNPAGVEGFESGAYLTEVRVPEKSKSIGLTLRKAEQLIDEYGGQIVGLVRNEIRIFAPNPKRKIYPRDILVIESEAETLSKLLSKLEVELEEAKPPREEPRESKQEKQEEAADQKPAAAKPGSTKPAHPDSRTDKNKPHQTEEVPKSIQREEAEPDRDSSRQEELDDRLSVAEEICLMELAVLPASPLAGQSAKDLSLRTRYGLNLLAISRQGRRSLTRLRSMTFRQGDLLLVQGGRDNILEFASDTGCVPLADRQLQIPNQRKMFISLLLMGGAIIGAMSGLMPAAIMFALGGVLSVIFRVLSARTIYQAVDWPVIVLLASLIPVAQAMETSGTAGLIASGLLFESAQENPAIALVMVLVATMVLSDLMNNAATAAVMCPIAISVSSSLAVSADPFLMAVAVGASCAFLTPIGHQNNTLILGPGGFGFGDYWRLGLLIEIIVVVVSIPMILWVWPL